MRAAAAGGAAFEAFNLADAVVDPAIVDIQDYIARRWPYARNRHDRQRLAC